MTPEPLEETAKAFVKSEHMSIGSKSEEGGHDNRPQSDGASSRQDPSSSTMTKTKRSRSHTTLLWPWMILFYCLGLIWFLLHPLMSITTGEFHKCRGYFIDEKALLNTYYTTRSYALNDILKPLMDYLTKQNALVKHQKKQYPGNAQSVTNSFAFCDLLQNLGENKNNTLLMFPFENVYCYSFNDSINLDIVQVLPDPSTSSIFHPSECIVFIVPPRFQSDNTIAFDAALLAMIHRLATDSPWLSKSVLFVSSSSASNSSKDTDTLEKVASRFENAILSTTSLPISLTSPIIRQVLVVDLYLYEGAKTKKTPLSPSQRISIVPQGRDGLMPNLDLVFMVVDTLSNNDNEIKKTIDMYPRKTKSQFLVNMCNNLKSMIRMNRYSKNKKFATSASTYVTEMCHMLQYMNALTFATTATHQSDNVAPHSLFLERGIHSLTMELPFPIFTSTTTTGQTTSSNEKDRRAMTYYQLRAAGDIVTKLEHMTRALSNLDEILHHSVSLYWMPSSTKFVSNAEYMLPLILLLLPLGLRVLQIVFRPNFAQPSHDRIYFIKPMQILFTCIVTAAIVSLAQLWLYNDVVILQEKEEEDLMIASNLEYLSSTPLSQHFTAQFDRERRKHIAARELKLHVIYLLLYRIALVRTDLIVDGTTSNTKTMTKEEMSNSLALQCKGGPTTSTILASVQCMLCYVLILMHLPLIVSNAAFAWPSLFIWSLLCSLPNAVTVDNRENGFVNDKLANLVWKITLYTFIVMTAPATWLFCFGEGWNLPPSLNFFYVSIHICWTRLILSIIAASKNRNDTMSLYTESIDDPKASSKLKTE